MAHKLRVNDIYPTDPSLEHFWLRAKQALPITDTNELLALISIHQNTVLNIVDTDTKEDNNES